MKAIRVHATGGAERLSYEDAPVPVPGKGEALVRHHAIGVNFIDIYHRTGLYPLPIPFTPGMEGAGIVDAVGEAAAEVAPGDRVAYAMNLGSYAEYTVVPAWKLVRIPDGLDFTAGAAALLQGMTAHYLAYSTYPLRAGEWAVVHAAAGGVGLLLIQIAARLGAHVVATVSTPAKAELARQAGADRVVLYEDEDFVAAVKEATGGKGAHVVYDSVGKTTFEKGLECLRPRGMLALYGQSSGLVPPFELGTLAGKGSLYVTRPILGHYTSTPEELAWRAGDVLGWVKEGTLRLRIEHTWKLEDAAAAHRALESRRTTGKVLLVP